MSKNFDDFGAKYLNAEDCEFFARELHKCLGFDPSRSLPSINEVLDCVRGAVPGFDDIVLTVAAEDRLGDALAIARPKLNDILIGDNSVDAVAQNEPEMRFTVFHELFHLFYHRGQSEFYRKAGGNQVPQFLHFDENRSEWQADRLARAFMMPPELVANCNSAFELSLRAKCPISEAIKRLSELKPAGPRVTPEAAAVSILNQKIDSATTSTERNIFGAEKKKLLLWNELPKVPGEDPTNWRKCGIFQISWKEFGRMTQCGWSIENDSIVAYWALKSF